MPSLGESVKAASQDLQLRREQSPDIQWIVDNEVPVHFGVSTYAYHAAKELDPEGEELPASETPDGVPGRRHMSGWILQEDETTDRRGVFLLLDNLRDSRGGDLGSVIWQQVTEIEEDGTWSTDIRRWAFLGYLAAHEHNGVVHVDSGISYVPLKGEENGSGIEPALPSLGQDFAAVKNRLTNIHLVGIGAAERPE